MVMLNTHTHTIVYAVLAIRSERKLYTVEQYTHTWH